MSDTPVHISNSRVCLPSLSSSSNSAPASPPVSPVEQEIMSDMYGMAQSFPHQPNTLPRTRFVPLRPCMGTNNDGLETKFVLPIILGSHAK